MKPFLLRPFQALLLVLPSLPLFSGEIVISGDNTLLRYTSNTYQQLSFENHLASILFREVQTKLGTFSELSVPGYGYSPGVGDPKLPVLYRLIELPVNASVQIEITRQEFREYDLAGCGVHFPVIPQQAPVSKEITDPDSIPFVKNDEVYLRDEFLGGPLVLVSPAGIMRAVRLACLQIAPVQYNPVTGKLRVYEVIEADIRFPGGSEQASLSQKQSLFSPFVEQAYNQVSNYKPLGDELITAAPVTYIIVSDPMFQTALRPFVHWKTRKGFKVVEAYTSDPAVGTTTTSIKNYLLSFYTNPPAGYSPQTFVLFVGDVAQIPAFPGTAGSHPTDLYFCEYTGDKIPECYYGRFSASNLSHLQPQIDKTLEYEQYLFPVDSFLGEAVMVAGADATYGTLHGNGQINYGTTYYFNTAHNILSHTYLQPEPPGANYSGQIQQNVSDGVAYANYTAHCSEQGWADPSFLISNIPSLQNAHKYCLMVGNCCLSNRFSVNCFGEAQLRAADKGALGYIGGTNNTYWDEDYWWGVGFKAVNTNPPYNPNHLGAYDVTFHDHGEPVEEWFVTQGQMVVGGNLAVQESSTSSNSKTYYWEIYHLMGDPSLMVYFSVPPALTATFQDIIPLGTSSLPVTTAPYAYIGLSKHDSVFLAAACADSAGNATLTFDPLSEPGFLDIVITKQNHKPILDSIQVFQPTGPYLTLTGFTVQDSLGGNHDHDADYSESVTLDVTVSNIGIQGTVNVTAVLSSPDTNILITDSLYVFDSIPAGSLVIGAGAFGLTVKNNVPDQHIAMCEILFSDGTGSWSSPLLLTLNAPVLTVSTVTVVDPAPGGNNNGILDPGESAIVRMGVSNTGHAGVGNAIGHLVVQPSSAQYIIVSTPNCLIGNLPVNMLLNVDFPVITNGITPAGTLVNLDYSETAGLQNQYSLFYPVELEIGQIPVVVMQNGTQTTCNVLFYDSGGENGNYSSYEDYTLTFTPASAGADIKAVFSAFDVEPSAGCNYDYLRIYNGNSILSPLIGTYCGTDSPGTVISTAPDGSLTFKFHSDYSETYSGWEAAVTCLGGPLNVMANAFPAVVCVGSSSHLSAIPSGGSGIYTFLWDPVTYLDDPASQFPYCTPETSITYTVTVNDGTTSLTSAPVDVTVVPKPDPPVILLNGDLLESSSPSGNQWYFNGAVIPGANQQIYQPQLSGDYYATVTDQITGCESEPSNIIHYLVTGISTVLADRMVTVFPNPFRESASISVLLPEASVLRITLVDALGRIVKVPANRDALPAGLHSITLESGSLQPGIYYCRVETASYIVIRKIILNR